MKLTRAILNNHGGPDAIEWVEETLPTPGAGQVLVENTAIGLNFIDTYHRSGLYPLPMPSGLGMEGAGHIVAKGDGVSNFAVGDRVAYLGPSLGAYATHHLIDMAELFALPDAVDDRTAAAALLKAATVEAFVERAAKVQPGDTVLVHAAAGGVGQIMVQWLVAIGAQVIATASTDAKLDMARAAGASHTILSGSDDIASQVRAITGGTGVSAVFDGVGKNTFITSLDSLRPRGLMVSFGNASGPVEGVNLAMLAQRGSIFITRPVVLHYYANPLDRAQGIARVWDMLEIGKIQVSVGATYPLTQAAQAHRDLEARLTTGSTLLLP